MGPRNGVREVFLRPLSPFLPSHVLSKNNWCRERRFLNPLLETKYYFDYAYRWLQIFPYQLPENQFFFWLDVRLRNDVCEPPSRNQSSFLIKFWAVKPGQQIFPNPLPESNYSFDSAWDCEKATANFPKHLFATNFSFIITGDCERLLVMFT